jgi:hypothetical protein
MGSAASSSSSSALSLSSDEKEISENNWNLIMNPETPLPSSASSSSKLYRHHFYSLCYQRLIQRTEEYYQQNPLIQKSYEDPNALHTVVIFMLKLLMTYLISLKSYQKTFYKYSKSLALSSLHLGIFSYNYQIFQNTFLEIIHEEFPLDNKLYNVWKKIFIIIFNIVLPECKKQEEETSLRRPLRMSGNSNLRAITMNETIEYYADYAYKLILITTTTGHGDDSDDPYSVNSRLSTSLHNSVDFDQSHADSSSIAYRSQISS